MEPQRNDADGNCDDDGDEDGDDDDGEDCDDDDFFSFSANTLEGSSIWKLACLVMPKPYGIQHAMHRLP
jgi:hypothetical protein